MKVIYFTTAQVVFITAKIAFIFTVGTWQKIATIVAKVWLKPHPRHSKQYLDILSRSVTKFKSLSKVMDNSLSSNIFDKK